MNRREMLAQHPIGPLLLKLSIPAMTGMLVMASYNVVDTIFVGWGVGPLGIAAVATAFPIQSLIHAVSMLFGVGTASLTSRSIGANDQQRADHALSNGITMAVIAGVLIMILALTFIDPLLKISGATPSLYSLSKQYLSITFWGAPFLMVGVLLNNTIRAEGNTKYAMCSMIIPAILNCILDPLFIFGFKWGVAGAAWATVIGQIVTLLWNLNYYLLTKKNLVTINPKLMPLNPQITKEITSVGASEFAKLSANAIAIMVMLNITVKYGNEMHIAAYGILSKITSLSVMPILGIGQGLQPIIGFCYGAKLYDRAKQAIKYALISATIISIIGEILIILFPQIIVKMFTNDPQLIAVSDTVIRIAMLTFFVLGFQIIGTVIFQALGIAGTALILSLSRQVLFFMPLLFILPRYFGITGVFMVYPVSDILAALVTAYFLLSKGKNLFPKTD